MGAEIFRMITSVMPQMTLSVNLQGGLVYLQDSRRKGLHGRQRGIENPAPERFAW